MRRALLDSMVFLLIFGCGNGSAGVDGATDVGVPEPDGAGDSGACEPMLCSAPGLPSSVSICGSLHYADTGEAVEGVVIESVRLEVVDGAFLEDVLATATVNACGAFSALDVPASASGSYAIRMDDSDQTDYWARTASFVPVARGSTVSSVRVLAIRSATDREWADCSFGAGQASFAARGAHLLIYEEESVPVAGVSLTGASAPDVFYMSGDEEQHLQCPTPSGPTRTNGAALLTNGPHTVSASGGEPAGCVWESDFLAAPAGTIAVLRKQAECP